MRRSRTAASPQINTVELSSSKRIKPPPTASGCPPHVPRSRFGTKKSTIDHSPRGVRRTFINTTSGLQTLRRHLRWSAANQHVERPAKLHS